MAQDRMRALSLKQPWLYAITDLGKRVENRTWKPPGNMVNERIALHASKKKDGNEWDAAEQIYGSPITVVVPTGVIVASAVITGWIDTTTGNPMVDPEWWVKQEKWFLGPVGWILDNLHVLDKPIPATGALKLWSISGHVERVIQKQLVRDKVRL